MNKKKKWIISILSFVIIVFTCVGLFSGIKSCNKGVLDFKILDTLEDGKGKEATIIILAGQSNASGCSLDEYLKKNVSNEKYSEYENGYDNVYINYFASGTNKSDSFVKCATKQGEGGGYFGPELGMAEALHETHPDELFFIIKCAWGGTDLYEKWLSPSSKGKTGVLYKSFINFVQTSVKYLVSKNYNIKIEGMCWMQGESDSFFVETATNYEENLKNLIKDVRRKYRRYDSDDGIALIDAYIAQNPVYWVYCDLVNESKRKVAESSPMNVVIDTNTLGLITTNEPENQPDIPHYDSLSEIKLGHLFIEYLEPFLD